MYLSEFQNNIKILLERKVLKQEVISRKKNIDIPKNVMLAIFDADPNADMNYITEYSEWLIRVYRTSPQHIKNRFIEDLYKAKEAFKILNDKKLKVDLFKFNSLNSLLDFTDKHKDVEHESQNQKKREKKQEGVKEFLYNDDTWLVLIPSEAGCFYAKGTRWCTTQDEMFNEYSKEGNLYIIINKKKNGKDGRNIKYQIHYQTEQFMDQNDNEINKIAIPANIWKLTANKETSEGRIVSVNNEGKFHTNDKYTPSLVTDDLKIWHIDGVKKKEIRYESNGNISHIIVTDDFKENKDVPNLIEYSFGKISRKEYYKNNFNLDIAKTSHRGGNKPARILYSKDGKITAEFYFINGELHNGKGAAMIKYNQDGKINFEAHFLKGEMYMDKDYPSVTKYYDNGEPELEFYGNRVIKKNTYGNYDTVSEAYRKNSKPNLIEYYKDGTIKALSFINEVKNFFTPTSLKPARTEYYPDGAKKTEYYMENGIINKKDGPAVVEYLKSGTKKEKYYLRGISLSKEEFDYINNSRYISERHVRYVIQKVFKRTPRKTSKAALTSLLGTYMFNFRVSD